MLYLLCCCWLLIPQLNHVDSTYRLYSLSKKKIIIGNKATISNLQYNNKIKYEHQNLENKASKNFTLKTKSVII